MKCLFNFDYMIKVLDDKLFNKVIFIEVVKEYLYFIYDLYDFLDVINYFDWVVVIDNNKYLILMKI